jgi:hypothetical protein
MLQDAKEMACERPGAGEAQARQGKESTPVDNPDDQMRHNDPNDPSTMSGEQSTAILSVPAGATVYDVAGEKLGKVGGGIALGDYFRLERGLLFPHEYYVPKSAIARIDVDGVHLNVTKDDIKTSGWDQPPTESVETLGHHEEPQV